MSQNSSKTRGIRLAFDPYSKPRFTTCILHHLRTSGWNPLRAMSGPKITPKELIIHFTSLGNTGSQMVGYVVQVLGTNPVFPEGLVLKTKNKSMNYNSVTWLLWHLIHQEPGQIIFSCPYSWIPLHFVVQVRLNCTSLASETHRILCTSFPWRFERKTIFEPHPVST